MTLTEFLLARIAEDEEIARKASVGHTWTWDDDHETLSSDAQKQFGHECIIDTEGANPPGPTPGAHIARWDPARVLAECEAKRQIVELHESWPVLVERQPTFSADSGDIDSMTMRLSQQVAWMTQREYRDRFGTEPLTAPMMRALATVYADHPDYREEWRP